MATGLFSVQMLVRSVKYQWVVPTDKNMISKSGTSQSESIAMNNENLMPFGGAPSKRILKIALQ